MAIIEIDGLHSVLDMDAHLSKHLELAEIGGARYLISVQNTLDEGIGVSSVSAVGTLAFQNWSGDDEALLDGYRLSASTLTSYEVGGDVFLYLTGEFGADVYPDTWGTTVLRLTAGGQLTHVQSVESETGAVSSTEPEVVVKGDNAYLLMRDYIESEGSVFKTYRIGEDGTLSDPQVSVPEFNTPHDFALATVENTTYVVTTGGAKIGGRQADLQVLRFRKDGTLVPTDALLRSQVAEDRPAGDIIKTVAIGERTFVVAAGGDPYNSILVYELSQDGALTLVERELPTYPFDDGWGNFADFETFEHDGRHYLVTGGIGESSLPVFQFSKDGALTEVDEYAYEPLGLQYSSAYDIEVEQFGGATYFFTTPYRVPASVSSLLWVPDGAPEINGGSGANTLSGTAADDMIHGRGGNDTVRARSGDDLVEGGAGDDRIYGGSGHDNAHGGGGNDTMLGGSGEDFLFGENGRDVLNGQGGGDVLVGGSGDDVLRGKAGSDRLFGDNGRDVLKGGNGEDELTDGGGKDKMVGGNGVDIFVFVADGQRDRILDFEDGVDRMDLRHWSEDLAWEDLTISQAGRNVLVRYGDESILVSSADGRLQADQLGGWYDFIIY